MTDNTVEKYDTNNAGLVIVHPFLPQLFKYLDFTNDEKQFKDEPHQQKAIQLILYLTTGADDYTVTDARAVNVMFGCGAAEVIIQPPLTANEKQYADELLTVVLTRWDKLHNTSITGLRETFLQRKGIIIVSEEGTHLTVETRATDILLDYIPWNISLFKLPWAGKILYCSWR
jgi:hypothetical protein